MSCKKLSVLVAYPYMDKKMVEALEKYRDGIEFFLDSGAFTAWNAGKPIELDDYCRFLERLPFMPDRYFALDVVGDPVATVENYKRMLERGFNPIPVFTPSQSFEDIEEYYKTTEIIGCGGLTTKYGKESIPYLIKVMKYCGGRKVHLLGYTKPEFVKHFRPYSCDSSSWLSARRFGTANLYIGQGKFVNFGRKQAIKKPRQEILNAIKNLGFSLTDFTKEQNWRGGYSIAFQVSTRSWCKYLMDAERAIGTKIFLAMTGAFDLNVAIKHWGYLNAPVST